ncbi:MAG: serine hydrolase [Ignavibacterium sp.]|nr:serine hydrolase [Ignavibacterium sp.]
MKKILLFLAIITLQNFPQDNMMSITDLKTKIENEFASVEGSFALAFTDLSNPLNEIYINERETFHAASTMKTPVMVELFKQANENKFNLNDSILVKNDFKSIVDGSSYSMNIERDGGENFYKHLGTRQPIIDLIIDMITFSGNLSTNILIELADAKKVNETMRSIGASDIQVLRGVEDMKAFEQGLNNTTTAYDLMLIYRALGEGSFVSEKACEDMIKILMQQNFKTKIPALLPDDVSVANKTGSITGVSHDSGIIFLPDGRKYVLVILSKNLSDMKAGNDAIAKASRYIYDYMVLE